MPILTLKFKGNTVQRYRIPAGRSVTIGRMEKNHIVIENLAVSGHHAKIDAVGDGYLLTDLQSKNGCFVNERMISTHWLQDGDVIHIGKHLLIFNYGPNDPRPKAPPTDMDKTMVLNVDRYRDKMDKHGEEYEAVGVLSYLAGGEGEIDLAKKLIKIGKEEGADIRVSGLTIGQTAATISRRPNGYFLNYVGGLSKPKINGRTVKESTPLNEFDIIEIGSVKLQFFTRL